MGDSFVRLVHSLVIQDHLERPVCCNPESGFRMVIQLRDQQDKCVLALQFEKVRHILTSCHDDATREVGGLQSVQLGQLIALFIQKWVTLGKDEVFPLRWRALGPRPWIVDGKRID